MMGNSDVAARGMASVTHITAMRTATAAMRVTSGWAGSRFIIHTRAKSTGPSTRPVVCSLDLLFTFTSDAINIVSS